MPHWRALGQWFKYIHSASKKKIFHHQSKRTWRRADIMLVSHPNFYSARLFYRSLSAWPACWARAKISKSPAAATFRFWVWLLVDNLFGCRQFVLSSSLQTWRAIKEGVRDAHVFPAPAYLNMRRRHTVREPRWNSALYTASSVFFMCWCNSFLLNTEQERWGVGCLNTIKCG